MTGAAAAWGALARPATLGRLAGYAPGLALVGAMAILAAVLEEVERRAAGVPSAPVEALVIAILIGVLARNVAGIPRACATGVSFAGKQLLEFAVLILGASVNFGQVLQAGPKVLLLIVLCVVLALAVSTRIGRWLGLPPKLAILVATGNAICGNSAIAAVAPAIKAEKRDVATSIALTAVVGVVLVLSLPFLVPLLHLTHYQYGALVGTTVYAVPQVVAASFPVSAEAGDVATFVKLLRVLMIGPAVLYFSLRFSAGGDGTAGGEAPLVQRLRRWRKAVVVPWFIAGFLVLAALNSLGLFGAIAGALGATPAAPAALAKSGSRLLMIVSMAALGLGVEFAAVRSVGTRVLAAVVGSVLWLIVLSLGLILLLGLR